MSYVGVRALWQGHLVIQNAKRTQHSVAILFCGETKYSSSPGRARKDFLATDTQVPRAQEEHTWHWVLPHQGALFRLNSASKLGCAPMAGMLTQHRRPQLQGHRLIPLDFSVQAELDILAQHPGHSKDGPGGTGGTGETSIREHRARTFSVTRSKVTVP